MKVQHRITFLLLIVIGVFMITFIGYHLVRLNDEKIFLKAKQIIDEKIIDNVLAFKAESFSKPTKDNSAWDDMVTFTKTKDQEWIKENLGPIMGTFSMSSLSVYANDGSLLYAISDSLIQPITLNAVQIKQMFFETATCNTYIISKGKLIELFGASIVPTSDIYRASGANGYLISAKLWDEFYISEIERATGYNVSINFIKNETDASSKKRRNNKQNHQRY